MAAIAEGHEVSILETGESTTVAADPTAKLMYYLNCVGGVLQLDNPNLSRLRNHQYYYLLSDGEIDALLALVLLFSPDELQDKVFFHSEGLRGSNNKFFELSTASKMVMVTENVVIGGERKKVAKIMLFNRSWIEENYFTPMLSFQYRLRRISLGLPGRAPSPPPARPPPSPLFVPRGIHNNPQSSSCNIL